MIKKSPFAVPAPPLFRKHAEEIECVTVRERLEMLEGMSPQRLREAIEWPGTQTTVRKAAERMLRRSRR